jgi:PIN domain nuclease of toxin-antitoxin system
MILLDTHIWVWWILGDDKLPPAHKAYIQAHETDGLGISAISCWEIAKLVENNRLSLPVPVGEWLDQALAYPGMRLLELTPQVAVESTQLPGTFHRDPADQLIVATARVYDCPLVTLDGKILAYQHVQVAPQSDATAA